MFVVTENVIKIMVLAFTHGYVMLTRNEYTCNNICKSDLKSLRSEFKLHRVYIRRYIRTYIHAHTLIHIITHS